MVLSGVGRFGFFYRGGAVLTAIALFVILAPSASAATPLSMAGESLTSTSGSASNSESPCPLGFVNDSGRFVVSGTATGLDPGTFSESGTFAVSGNNFGPLKSSLHAYFNAIFTITSPGMLPITGTLSGQGFGAHCFGGAYSLFNMPISYALTGNYSGSGTAGWPASGALVNATLSTTASVTESFAP